MHSTLNNDTLSLDLHDSQTSVNIDLENPKIHMESRSRLVPCCLKLDPHVIYLAMTWSTKKLCKVGVQLWFRSTYYRPLYNVCSHSTLNKKTDSLTEKVPQWLLLLIVLPYPPLFLNKSAKRETCTCIWAKMAPNCEISRQNCLGFSRWHLKFCFSSETDFFQTSRSLIRFQTHFQFLLNKSAKKK